MGVLNGALTLKINPKSDITITILLIAFNLASNALGNISAGVAKKDGINHAWVWKPFGINSYWI